MATNTSTARPLTANQSSYLRSLVAKITSVPVQDAIKADLNTLLQNRLLTVTEASRQIDRVKAVIGAQAVIAATPVPVVAPAPAPRPVVSQGRYAVEVSGVLRFYFVKVDGGRFTVQRYISDSLTRVSWVEAQAALRAIEAAGEHEAAMAFARETTRCYTCGRRLTDPESRERGQGPECHAKGL